MALFIGSAIGIEQVKAAMSRGLKILIIHHDPQVRYQLSIDLAELGCDTFEAECRTDALPLMYQIHPDLIFIQLLTDEEEGWETMARVRLFTDTPVVVLAEGVSERVYELLDQDRTLVLFQPVSAEQAIAEACQIWDLQLPAHTRRADVDKAITPTLPSRSLQVHDALPIDNILHGLDPTGQVHLIIHQGKWRILANFKIQVLGPEPHSEGAST